MSALEDRYRRLLRWYPVEHRRVHEEEMLGVLLAAAGPEQTRPSARETLDLARSGLWIRIRRAPGALAHAGWRDAAALLSVLAPLVLLAAAFRYAVQAILIFPEARDAAARSSSWAVMYSSAPSWLLWAAAAVAALCGARRLTAAGVLAAVLADFAAFVRYDGYPGGTTAAPIFLGLVTVIALSAGPGAARGRELLGRTGLVGVSVLMVVVAPLDSTMVRYTLGVIWPVRSMGLAIAALLVAGWLARGAGGRRAVIVLAAPLYPVIAPFYPAYIEDPLTRVLVTMIAIPVAIGLAALVVVAALECLVIRPVTRRTGTAG
jgi:hypothetical protein